MARTDPSTSPSYRRPTSMLSTASSAAPRHCRRHDGGWHQLEGMLRIVVQNAQTRCPQHAHEAWACAGLVSLSSRLISIGITCGDAKIVPLWKQLVMLGRGVRACSRFDRLTHHAHGHGGYIAAGGDVGSPFGGRAQADGRCRAWVLVHTCVPHLFRG